MKMENNIVKLYKDIQQQGFDPLKLLIAFDC